MKHKWKRECMAEKHLVSMKHKDGHTLLGWQQSQKNWGCLVEYFKGLAGHGTNWKMIQWCTEENVNIANEQSDGCMMNSWHANPLLACHGNYVAVMGHVGFYLPISALWAKKNITHFPTHPIGFSSVLNHNEQINYRLILLEFLSSYSTPLTCKNPL